MKTTMRITNTKIQNVYVKMFMHLNNAHTLSFQFENQKEKKML